MKTEKRCPKHNDGAGAVLPASFFYVQKNAQGKSKLAGYCKECSKEIAKQYHRANPEKARAAVRKVFEMNPAKRKEYEAHRPPGYRADWARNDRRKSPIKHWKYHIKKKYGVTPQWYEDKLAEQGGHCALCDGALGDQRNRMLCVDHNHLTGAVRGLLCPRCNNTLERIETHVGWAERAFAYLASYKNA